MRLTRWTLAPEMEEQELELILSVITEFSLRGTFIEIGTGAGGTACRMMRMFSAESRPPFVLVDPMTYFPNQLAVICRNLRANGVEPNTVDIRAESSAHAFKKATCSREEFSFILIDGNHALLHVMLDLRWTRMLTVPGIVCIHDCSERFAGVRRAVRRFLVRNDNRFRLIAQARSILIIEKTAGGSHHEFSVGDWVLASAAQYARVAGRKIARFVRRYSRRVRRKWSSSYAACTERYVAHELRHLASGIEHPTLGNKSLSDGRVTFEALLNLGLARTHRIVDFGCGSLRLGRHLIEYLDGGQYWGLDVTQRFIRIGLDGWFSARPLPSKVARFGVITPAVLGEVARAQPDVVLISGVLHCVQGRHLPLLMAQVASVCTKHTQVVATLLEANISMRRSQCTFRHSLEDVRRAAGRAGMSLVVIRPGREPGLLCEEADSDGIPERATLLLLAKSLDEARAGALRFETISNIK